MEERGARYALGPTSVSKHKVAVALPSQTLQTNSKASHAQCESCFLAAARTAFAARPFHHRLFPAQHFCPVTNASKSQAHEFAGLR